MWGQRQANEEAVRGMPVTGNESLITGSAVGMK